MRQLFLARSSFYEKLFEYKEQITDEIIQNIKNLTNDNCWGMYINNNKDFIPIFNTYIDRNKEKEQYIKHIIIKNPYDLIKKINVNGCLIIFIGYDVNLIIRITRINNGFTYEDTNSNLFPLEKKRKYLSKL